MFSSSAMLSDGFGSQTLQMGFGGSSQAASTSDAAGRKPKQEDKQACLPVTIRAVQEAAAQRVDDGGDIRIHGVEPGMLVLVAAVEAVVRQSASLELSLNDATGRIKARYYVPEQRPDLQEIAPGQYVSLFGSVRAAPELHLALTGLRLVRSADEVSYHTVEAAHAALKLRKGAPADPATPSPKRPARDGALADSTPPKAPDAEQVAAARPAGLPPPPAESAAAAAAKGPFEGAGLRGGILAFVQREGEGKPEGISLAAVLDYAKPAPADEVRGVLEQLVGDGDVFNTIDGEHFQGL